MADHLAYANEAERAIANTEEILTIAAELDPVAWESPLRDRMNARRSRSYKAAVEEFKARISFAEEEAREERINNGLFGVGA